METKQALTLNTLKPLHRLKTRKRLGRGDGSGHGGTSTRGHKGQKARAGGYHKRGFEGGQMPLSRRIPKRGFTNIFRMAIGVINLGKLADLPKGSEINLALAKEKGWVSASAQILKILGTGDLKHPLVFKTVKVSESARKKIEKAGGSIQA